MAIVVGDGDMVGQVPVTLAVIRPDHHYQPAGLHFADARFPRRNLAGRQEERPVVPSSAPISAAQDGTELPGWVRAIGELIKASRTEKIARSRFNTWPGGFQQLGITPFDHLRNLPSASFVVGERNEIVPWLKPSCRGNRDALFKIVPIEAISGGN